MVLHIKQPNIMIDGRKVTRKLVWPDDKNYRYSDNDNKYDITPGFSVMDFAFSIKLQTESLSMPKGGC